MSWFYLFSVWLHILAASVWVGGMLFLAVVVLPVARRKEFRDVSTALLGHVGYQFRLVGWVTLGLLVGTGLINLGYRGFGWAHLADGSLWAGHFGGALAIKLALVVAALTISAVHDFWLGPSATRRMEAAPDQPGTARLRAAASWFGRINLLLALAIVYYAVKMVR